LKKKRWFFIYFLVFSCALEALPLGNPAEAELFCDTIFFDSCFDCAHFRAGYYGDFVFQRKMRVEKKDFARNVTRTEIFTNAGYLNLNLFKRVDLFSTLGTSRITIETDAQNFISTPVFPFNTLLYLKPRFSWSVGGRAILYKYNCWVLGVEGQYLSTSPEINKYQDFIFAVPIYLKGRAHYREWQVGAVLSYEIFSCFPNVVFVPYIGGKWSRSLLDLKHLTLEVNTPPPFIGPTEPLTLSDLKSKLRWGFPLGVTILFNRCFDFTLEGRFGDEHAFSIIAQGRF
jgi:hypothetical protein